MSRNENTKRKFKDKKQSYQTNIYSENVKKNDDLYFIAQEGDRCDNLAFRFYGDSTLWWFIAKCNDLTTNNIPAGTSLRIPIKTNEAKAF